MLHLGKQITIWLALSMSLIWTTSAFAQGDDRNEDRQQIAGMLREWENAWNTHDMHKLAGLFQEDGIWVLWTGDVWVGRARFEQGMAEVHQTVYRNSRQLEQLEELTFTAPDSAVLRFQSSLTGDTRYPDRIVHSRKILVVRRNQGQWRVGWGQNTRFWSDLQKATSLK